jgi:peroxiredoxin
MLSIIALIGFSALDAQLPSVTLKNLDGKNVDTAKLSNKGKPYVISFFALWCKPCLRELSAIHEVYADWQAETGMKLVAVSCDQGQDTYKVAPHVNGNGWEFEVLLDPNNDFKRALGLNEMPSLVIVDGNGKIVSKHTGYKDGSEKKLIEEIKKIIAETK